MSYMKQRFIEWEAFDQQVAAAGLQAVMRSAVHWQIKGGKFSVNYYPGTGTIYVNQTCGGRRKGKVEDAIRAANEVPPIVACKRSRPRHKKVRNLRLHLFNRGNQCHWCKREMQYREATLEHIIPLARGGSNGMDNLTLACLDCNRKRGHDMPEVIELP